MEARCSLALPVKLGAFANPVRFNSPVASPVILLANPFRYLSNGAILSLSNLILKLMENFTPEIPKCINVSGDDVLSKYDIGLMIAKKYKYDEKLIVPISMDSDNKIFSEKRANCTLLDNSLLKKTLGISEIKIEF